MTKLTVSYYKTETLDIERLQPFQGNLKDLSEANYKKLRKQILDNGFAEPFSVWENEGNIYILNGHQRHREIVKMKEEGINVPALPCNFIRCANRKEAKKMVLALTSQYGNMTEDGLYEFLEESGIGFEEMRDCFNFPEINMDDFGAGYYGDDIQSSKGEDDDYEIPETIETDIKFGDLFEIGPHRLLCGDSTDSDQVGKLMNGEKADIAFTSPPYNTKENAKLSPHQNNGTKYNSYSDDLEDNEYLKLLTDFTNNSLLFSYYSFVNIQSLSGNKTALIDFLYNMKSVYADTLIWQKQNAQPAMAENVLNSQFEYIHVFSHKANRAIGTKRFRGTLTNVIDISKQNKNGVKEHNATFPIDFATHFVQNFCEHSVLDLFLGSGTTMVAAHQLNRKCYGMELDPGYCQVIVDRMLKLDNTLEIKKNGAPFQPGSLAS